MLSAEFFLEWVALQYLKIKSIAWTSKDVIVAVFMCLCVCEGVGLSIGQSWTKDLSLSPAVAFAMYRAVREVVDQPLIFTLVPPKTPQALQLL